MEPSANLLHLADDLQFADGGTGPVAAGDFQIERGAISGWQVDAELVVLVDGANYFLDELAVAEDLEVARSIVVMYETG